MRGKLFDPPCVANKIFDPPSVANYLPLVDNAKQTFATSGKCLIYVRFIIFLLECHIRATLQIWHDTKNNLKIKANIAKTFATRGKLYLPRVDNEFFFATLASRKAVEFY